METSTTLAVLGALAQRSRLAIFRQLVEIGPEGVFAGQLAQTLAIAPAVLSFHLKTLSHAGLVESESDGRFVRYRANFAAMNELIAYLTENCCGGRPQLCAEACRPAPKRRPRERNA